MPKQPQRREERIDTTSVAGRFIRGEINKSEFITFMVEKLGMKGKKAFESAERLQKRFNLF